MLFDAILFSRAPKGLRAPLRLLLNDDTPLVLLASVHDVLDPLLDDVGVLAALALAHVELYLFSAVVHQRHGADEVLN